MHRFFVNLPFSLSFIGYPVTLPRLHDCDFFGGEGVEVVDEVVDLGFEGLDGGGGIGLLGGEDAIDERFDRLLFSG